jgi:hypothetical protein
MKDFTEQEIILGCKKGDGRFQRLLFDKYYSKNVCHLLEVFTK